MSYNKIINPYTGRKISVYGKKGSGVIQGYYDFLIKNKKFQKGGGFKFSPIAAHGRPSVSLLYSVENDLMGEPDTFEDMVVDATQYSGEQCVQTDICDASYIFKNYFRNENMKKDMRDTQIYTDSSGGAQHNVFDEIIDTRIDILGAGTSTSEKAANTMLYLKLIKYLISKCPCRKMKVYGPFDVGGTTSHSDLVLVESDIQNMINAQNTNQTGHPKIQNVTQIRLSSEDARPTPPPDYPFKKVLSVLTEFNTKITKDVSELTEEADIKKLNEVQKYLTNMIHDINIEGSTLESKSED